MEHLVQALPQLAEPDNNDDDGDCDYQDDGDDDDYGEEDGDDCCGFFT